jgi:hypothetical protein
MAYFSVPSMPAPDVHAMLEAAEQAAAAGDWTTAEQVLRGLVGLQEAQPDSHAELAKLLNNLGVVCERAGKPDEAERCYRRAYAVAAAGLPPDDPLVATSGRNLRDFCEALGKPVEPATPPVPPPQPAPVRTQATSDRAHGSFTPRRPRVAVALGIGGVLLLGAVLTLWRSALSPSTATDTTARPAATTAPPPPVAVRLEPGAAQEKAPAEPRPSAQETPVQPRAAAPEPSARHQANASVTIVEARVCSSLSTTDWQCKPAATPAVPGVYFFFTRVRSTSDTTVEHRWYYGDALLRTVTLRVSANPRAGYRTYSRNTIIPERAGNWRVQLRDRNGSLLHEERFVVR